jgi:sterol desaturase/sphingolipid hydroxylase (fatty acid hydroxylase superfamily)
MEGITVILWTLAMTIVLELWSIETVRNLQKQQPGGTGLHREAWISSILNPLLCGIPVYVLAAALFCVEVREGVNDTWVHSLRSILCTVVLHSCQYYAIHKAFHEHPQLYQRFHRFHHRFHTYTPPSAANAVTMGEYVLAYLIPFLLPLLVVETSTRSLQLAVIIISGCNLLVHTPPIEDWLPWKAPSWWVSTTNHQDHHRKSMKSHYASPTFNIDTLVSWYSSRRPQLHEDC